MSGSLTKRVNENREKFIEQHAYDKIYENKELTEYAVPIEYSRRHRLLTSSFNDSIIFTDLLPKMTLVSLVSVFDAYLARLVKTLFSIKPESLNCSNKQLTFSQLTEFDSIESAREYVVDCEIESLLRVSHSKQFDWLEEKLGIKLRKDLSAWKCFVELTERRNLLVHADGLVNKQYLTVCANEKYPLYSEVDIGTKLDVTPDYYREACDCVTEIGIKLNQVMWRKLLPDDSEAADDSVISVTYDLLEKEDYKLVETILKFATRHPIKNHSTESSLFMKVNLAISLKSQDKEEECITLLNSIDWSALAPLFKLASVVLHDDFDEAANLMKEIGGNGRPTKDEYKVWPLFKWFRKTDEFKEAFQEVFSEPYRIIAHADVIEGESDEDEEAR